MKSINQMLLTACLAYIAVAAALFVLEPATFEPNVSRALDVNPTISLGKDIVEIDLSTSAGSNGDGDEFMTPGRIFAHIRAPYKYNRQSVDVVWISPKGEEVEHTTSELSSRQESSVGTFWIEFHDVSHVRGLFGARTPALSGQNRWTIEVRKDQQVLARTQFTLIET